MRRVPAVRDGIGERGVAPEQVVVEVKFARHEDARKADADGLQGRIAGAWALSLPVDAIPDRAGMFRPALVPEVGQLNRHPAFGGACVIGFRSFGGLCGQDVVRAQFPWGICQSGHAPQREQQPQQQLLQE